MNYLAFLKNLGLFCIASTAMFLPALACAVIYWETHTFLPFLGSMLISSGLGLFLYLTGRKSNHRLFQRETLALVGVGWLVAAGFGAFPYVFSGHLSFVDAYFESMSGFTTTGATILEDIECLPKSLLFWRGLTHWLGGLGIVLLLVIVLPFLGAGGKMLYRSEVPGVDKSGLRPRIKDSAMILLKIYLGLTVAMTAALCIAGLDLFDALVHTFGALATGGFSNYNKSVAYFDSFLVEIVIVFFMAVAASNFGVLYCLIRRQFKKAFTNSEWLLYLAILALASLVITLNLHHAQENGHAIIRTQHQGRFPEIVELGRMALFQATSIMTTTGYCTEDFNLWPSLSKAILVLLMFVGGCSGSTGGGLKVVRILMLFKMAYWQLERAFKPRNIRVLVINGAIIQPETQHAVFAFFFLYISAFIFSVVYLTGLGLPLITAFTAVAACLNNVGPGLELVGAVETYTFIPASGKALLSILMAMGRLELYAICVLFLPSFWKRY